MNLLSDTNSLRYYCRHHKLSRPTINWVRIVSVIALFEITIIMCAYLLQLSANSFLLFYEISNDTMILIFGRIILQQLVKIYQRYAPDSVRRRCTCKPTCSEYALLALQKYIWPKALVLIVRRLARTCQRPGYKIDYP